MLWRNHRSSNDTAKGKRNKIDFQAGILNGFSESLTGQSGVRGREVIRIENHDLLVFQQSRHRHISRQKGKRYYLSDAYKTGEQAGKNLKLRKGVENEPKKPTLRIP